MTHIKISAENARLAYNIAANESIKGKCQFDPVSRLYSAQTLLEVSSINDRKVDTIINLNLKK
ncbi:MAG: hypothetical protein SNH18_10415 [Rikenellaceae bacterium]